MHIQEEDAKFWNLKCARSPKERIDPLYTLDDAHASEGRFRPVAYDEPHDFAPSCTATWLDAGHILGSACILISVHQGRPLRILFTGDLGRFHMPILRDPTNPLPQVDYLITESTYAGTRHADPTDMKNQLVRIINQAREAGGKVIIPAFSVGRTQNVVYYLSQAVKEGLLEPLPVYVDSPLSSHATDIFKKHPECYDREARDFWWHEGDIFGKGLVTYINDVSESKALNSRKEPMVIIASQGMCEAGAFSPTWPTISRTRRTRSSSWVSRRSTRWAGGSSNVARS